MINKVILTGRLTNDIELKQTNDGIYYTYFTLAVNKQSKDKKTDFVPCVAWRNQAEFLKNYLNKGSLIGIEGKLEVFTTQIEGKYSTRVTVNVSQIHFLESKKEKTNSNDSSRMTFEKENSNYNNMTSRESSSDEINNNDFDEIDFENIKF